MKEINFTDLANFHDKQKEAHAKVKTHKYLLYGGAMAGGKGQQLSAVVNTPFGPRKMGEMKIGSVVCTPDGSTAKVIQIHPLGNRQMYRFTFDDGASTEVTEDHLWFAWSPLRTMKRNGKRLCGEKSARIWETKTLFEQINNSSSREFSIPVTNPVFFAPNNGRWGKNRPIHPYVLGVLLGDGCLSASQSNPSFSSINEEIVERVSLLLGEDTVTATKGIAYYIKGKKTLAGLRTLKLWGHLAGTKSVPEFYKVAPIEDRFALMQGLMDTDGFADARGHAQYTTISEQLAKDVQWVARSLGYRASISGKMPNFTHKGEKRIGRKAYTVEIMGGDSSQLFSIKRKVVRGAVRQVRGRKIISVEKTGIEEAQCITLDHPDGLYLTDDFIVTHNSYFIRWEAVYLLLYYASKYNMKGVRVGIFCEDYPALKDRHLSKVPFEFPDWLGTLNKSDHEFTLKPEFGGGIIAFRNLDDVSKYLSAEFAAIFVDEITRNKREIFDFLNVRLRWAGIPDTKFVAATNPGGVGHGFVKKLWINRDFQGEDFDPDEFAFVQAKYSDNKYIPKEYEKQLESLPEQLRKAYKEGNWDIFAGQFFTEFNRERHVRSWKGFLDDPATKTWWDKLPTLAGLDYGYVKPSAVNWGKYDVDNDKWYIYKELYETNLEYPALAKKIKEKGEPEMIYFDPAINAKKDSPRSGKDEIRDNLECGMKEGFNERVQGWNILRDYLKNDRIIIFDTCPNLIRTLPELVYSEHAGKEEDCDTNGDDHAADDLRYLIATHKKILAQKEKLSYSQPKQESKSDFEEAFSHKSDSYTAGFKLT